MKKKLIIASLCIFFLVGCDNKEEVIKNEYISMKSNLLEEEKYTKSEDLPLDIIIDIKREDEIIKYSVKLKNPKENMKDMRVMVAHNYFSENLFPSVGIFDDKKELLTNNKDEFIELTDTIDTTKDISKLDLELKVWIEYKNDLNEKKEIIYKTT